MSISEYRWATWLPNNRMERTSVYRRVNDGAKAVYAATGERKQHHEWTETREGYVYRIDDSLLYNLLLDLDSLLFEVNSSCELMTSLFEQLCAHVGKPLPRKPAGLAIRDILLEADGYQSGECRFLE